MLNGLLNRGNIIKNKFKKKSTVAVVYFIKRVAQNALYYTLRICISKKQRQKHFRSFEYTQQPLDPK